MRTGTDPSFSGETTRVSPEGPPPSSPRTPVARQPPMRAGAGLATRFSVAAALLVLLTLGGAVAVGTWRANEVAEKSIRESLSVLPGIFRAYQGSNEDALRRGGVAVDRTPPFVVLQGCYTLDRSDPFILFDRGTQSIVATSAAIYSASGSAFARALFDSLLYAGADLGTAVRNARNYLLAVTTLKKQRGHSDWTKTYRAALAFALWGDPTARAPLAPPTSAVPPATWQLGERALTLAIPPKHLEPATVGPYTAQPVPRAMLSGLILRDGRTLRGTFLTCKYVVPIMKRRGKGKIVNIASLGGRTGRPGVGVNYAASKAGVIGMTQTLARELGPYGIYANAIAPGPILTDLTRQTPPETFAKWNAGRAVTKDGLPEDVADAVLFLASDRSDWIGYSSSTSSSCWLQ